MTREIRHKGHGRVLGPPGAGSRSNWAGFQDHASGLVLEPRTSTKVDSARAPTHIPKQCDLSDKAWLGLAAMVKLPERTYLLQAL